MMNLLRIILTTTWLLSFFYAEHYAEAHPQAAGGEDLMFLAVAILLSVIGSQHSLLKNQQLLYLGKISYGLYVIHEFAHFCAIRLVHASTPLMVLVQSGAGLVLTILLAAASYRWLESPFLKLKERFSHVQSRPV